MEIAQEISREFMADVGIGHYGDGESASAAAAPVRNDGDGGENPSTASGSHPIDREDSGERKYVIALGKPYRFEDRDYTEVDLSGLEQLTVQDAIDAQLALFGAEPAANMICETTTAFARQIAVKATGLPVEFFKLAPRGLSKKIVQAVRAYLNRTEKQVENHILPLEQPRWFQGRQVSSVDLSGIADLSSMHESEAENRLARAGFMITENSFNYLYACVIAAMATGLPEEFFTSLPLYELSKLKNAVNDSSFFE